MKEIYVGNLPWSLSEKDLKNAFLIFGKVEKVSIISDSKSNRSKGFGFVKMHNANEAKKAIKAMNGSEMGGRNLRVNEARPLEDSQSSKSNKISQVLGTNRKKLNTVENTKKRKKKNPYLPKWKQEEKLREYSEKMERLYCNAEENGDKLKSAKFKELMIKSGKELLALQQTTSKELLALQQTTYFFYRPSAF